MCINGAGILGSRNSSSIFKKLSENAHLLRLSAFGGLPLSLVPPGRRPYPPACKPYGLEAGPEALRRTSMYASFLGTSSRSKGCGMDIFHQLLKSRFSMGCKGL
jgi:hypothetical protein